MSYHISILALAAAIALLATQSDAAVKLNSSKSNAYRQEQNIQARARGSVKATGNARQGSSTGGSPAARATTVKSSKSNTSD
jgi:hypothetical protein